MFTVVIKKLKYSLFLLLILSSVQVLGYEFKCFKSSETVLINVSSIAVGLSDDLKYISSMVLYDTSGNREVTELGCPLFPLLGNCSLADDGGVFQLFNVESDLSSIDISIVGDLKITRVLPEGYAFINIDSKSSEETRIIKLERAEPSECRFY